MTTGHTGARGRAALLATAALLIAGLGGGESWAEYGDVRMNALSQQRGAKAVVFSHSFHRLRFRCNVCHEQLGIAMKTGATGIDMQAIADGKYCGACHNGEIAWPPIYCDRCHSGGTSQGK